ncbi:Uncharacterised protein [Pandoraea pulmonicola]|uniref:Uncharacterized protein n=1 Tax=Pandoraea pulmonicola TaxID=93221 RepID=A0AAJ4ZFE8_PANPU|nr:Uncharacterised protein [Pandoraea pulmonicola]
MTTKRKFQSMIDAEVAALARAFGGSMASKYNTDM